MKKFTSLICLFALTLIIATPALAEATIRPGKVNREEFRTKLASIRDEKKKTIVEKIDQRIVQINANRTNIMTRNLIKIEEVLNKIEARALDKTAIATARTTITQSRSAVATQAAKTYTIDITTEANLGSAVSSVRTAFAKDLQATHQTVVTARKAVRDVLTSLIEK